VHVHVLTSFCKLLSVTWINKLLYCTVLSPSRGSMLVSLSYRGFLRQETLHLLSLPLCIKPRLRERFLACDGDAMFLENCRVAGARRWLHLATKSVILSQKIQLIEFLAIFFLRYFQLSHHLCEGGYTCDFRRALVT